MVRQLPKQPASFRPRGLKPSDYVLTPDGTLRLKTAQERLSPKQRELVRLLTTEKGITQREAYARAYNVADPSKITNASTMVHSPNVRAAIAEALTLEKATPAFAIRQIVEAAEQSKDMSTKLKASESILRLHGYREEARPTVAIEFTSDFFKDARHAAAVDGEVVEDGGEAEDDD